MTKVTNRGSSPGAVRTKKNHTDYPSISIVILLIFSVYIVIWWLQLGLRRPFFGQIRLEFMLGAVLGAIALYRLHAVSLRVSGTNAIVGWSIAYILILGLGIPFAENVAVAWDAYFNHVLKYAVVSFFISQFVVSPKGLKIFLGASFLAFLKIGQESFLGKVTGSMVWYNQGIPRLHGIQGTMFGHPNSLSGKSVMVLPFLWYLFPSVRSKALRILILVELMFVVNIILFTGSRTGYMASIFVGLVILGLSSRKSRLIALLAIIAVVAVSATPIEYKERFVSSFTGEEREGQSSDARIQLFKDSLYVFAEDPTGVGLRNFALVQRAAGRRGQDTHNLYTQLLSEAGIQGFFVFMGLVITILSKALALRRKFALIMGRLINIPTQRVLDNALLENQLAEARFLHGVSSALIVFILVRLALGVFGHDMLEIYWWIAAGLAVSLTKIEYIAAQKCNSLIGSNKAA